MVLLKLVLEDHHYSQSIGELIGHSMIKFIWALFCFYQLYFFSKKEVKAYMNDKGVTLF